MKAKIRNIYPGGNTPVGFYSYYSYILPQREAKKIFCIKGGPGVGKSTLMKRVGRHFTERGEDADFLWCSSDPDSLDGVVLRKRGVALIDGTAPHIVDPINPGAVDEIVNLGEFWDETGIRESREAIMTCSERIRSAYNMAYGYLAVAGKQYELMEAALSELIPEPRIYDVKRRLQMKLGSVSAVKRAESRSARRSAMGEEQYPGDIVKRFSGAITPGGLRSSMADICEGMERVIALRVPAGFPVERLLVPAATRLTEAGFDIEEYYSPMNPEKRLEHIVIPDAALAVVCCDDYHALPTEMSGVKVTEIELEFDAAQDGMYADIWRELAGESAEQIDRAIEMLQTAKNFHDELEGYYVPHMDFERIGEATESIIAEIEQI